MRLLSLVELSMGWEGVGVGNFFLYISSSLVSSRVHNKTQLCILPGSALKVSAYNIYQNFLYKVKICHPFQLTGLFLNIFRQGQKNNVHYRRPCRYEFFAPPPSPRGGGGQGGPKKMQITTFYTILSTFYIKILPKINIYKMC